MYNSRSAHGTQTPDETIRHQAGTCRDFALLMIESARSMGFAARFVTGYVYVPDRDGPVRLGGGSTHAWCQIYVPGSGWVEFDPTNGIVGNRELIRVPPLCVVGGAVQSASAVLMHTDPWLLVLSVAGALALLARKSGLEASQITPALCAGLAVAAGSKIRSPSGSQAGTARYQPLAH
jgi:hypothetical protein